MSRVSSADLLSKQREALAMRRNGLSYDEIAERLGYASRSSAWRLVTGALRNRVDEAVDEYRTLTLERLDCVLAAHWKAATAGDIVAARIVLRVMEAQVKVLGLDRDTDPADQVPMLIIGGSVTQPETQQPSPGVATKAPSRDITTPAPPSQDGCQKENS